MIRLEHFAQLAASLGAVWWFLRNDVAEYAAFKLLIRSAERQRRYLVWTCKSFALFFGLGVLNLVVLRRMNAPFALPAEFGPVSAGLHSVFSRSQSFVGLFLAGMGGGVLAALILGAVLGRKRNKPFPLGGDVEPLLPRNGAETLCISLMSVNAGLSEELFFRLVLPLLLVSLFGNAVVCFVMAAIVFGLCHWYQGIAGVMVTAVLGLALTAVYLGTGSLSAAMAVHAGLDVFNMVVRPWLQRVLSAAIPARS